MSKKYTQVTGWQLLKNSFFELFHPKAKCPLLNYKSLHVIDHNQLKFVHIPTMAMFFQYIGAFSVFFLIVTGFMFRYMEMKGMLNLQQSQAVTYFAVDQAQYSDDVAYEQTMPAFIGESAVLGEMVAEYAPEYGQEVETDYVPEMYAPSEPETADVEAVPYVLGEMISAEPAYAQTNSCSFVVNDTFVPLQAAYALDGRTAARVCADFDSSVSESLWMFISADQSGAPLSPVKNCVDLYSVAPQSRVEVATYDGEGNFTSQCEFSFVQ